MKITPIHILALALSLLCLSCSEDSSAPSLQEYPVDVEFDVDMTKVGNSGNDLFWQSGDQVAFRATGASGASAVTVLTLNDVDSGLAKAKFKGAVTMSEAPVKCEFAFSGTFDDEGNAVFDYSQQDGTHKPYLYGAADYSAEGMNCVLGHVGGLIRLTVAEGVESVSLSSNSGSYTASLSDGISEYVGQKISKVIFSEAGVVAASEDASHLIDVAVPSGAGVVYMFMPAMEFVDGFSIVCTKGNEKMFRSFSKTGGNSSSYSFLSGKVLDIDLSEFVGFTAECTYVCEHSYDESTGSKILTGTYVGLTDFTFSGSPAKIIDQWGVAIYDSDMNFIRWTSGTSLFNKNDYGDKGKQMEDYTGNWPLLIPGKEYVVYATCAINGHVLSFEMKDKLSVGHPDIVVSPIAETSWSYRSDPDKANSCGNNTIERMGFKINVSNNILNHSVTDYGFKAYLQNTPSGENKQTTNVSGNVGVNVNFNSMAGLNWFYNTTREEYELNNGDGIYKFSVSENDWGEQTVTAVVTFAGQAYSATTKAHITGLPYRHDFRAAEGLDGGTITGSRVNWHSYNGYEIYQRWTAVSDKYENVFYSRDFMLPGETSVKYNTSFFFVNTGSELSRGTCTAYTGITNSQSPSTTSSAILTSEAFTNIDAIGTCAAKTEHVVSGTGNFGSSSRISASIGDKDMSVWVQTGLYMGYLEIIYN